MADTHYTLYPIGVIHSPLTDRSLAPMQGYENAPDAWLEVHPSFIEAIDGLTVGDEIILITWLHLSGRDILKVHPRGDLTQPLTGVFATRSPNRPNPLGLHRVTVYEIAGNRLKVGPLEAIDGTPVVDVKIALDQSNDA